MTYEIEYDVPMPKIKRKSRLNYPFSDLTKVGASFFVAGATPRSLYHHCNKARKEYGHRYLRDLAEKNGEMGVRVWRAA